MAYGRLRKRQLLSSVLVSIILKLLNCQTFRCISRSTGNDRKPENVYRVRATEGVVEAGDVSHERSFVRLDAVHDIF